MWLCSKCGMQFKCDVAAVIHVWTWHLHSDSVVPLGWCTEDGDICLACMLLNTMPLAEYNKMVGKW